MVNCETCEENGIERAGEERGLWVGDGPVLCDDCHTSEAEAAHERMLEDYYGGSGPQSITEQCAVALKERNELRRRD